MRKKTTKTAPKPRKKSRVSPKRRKVVSKRKPASSQKGPSGEKETGRVIAFFRIPVVAVIRIVRGGLHLGDRVWIKGHTTDMKETIASMQVNHQPISEAKKGDEVGLKVSSRARRGDRVYLITS